MKGKPTTKRNLSLLLGGLVGLASMLPVQSARAEDYALISKDHSMAAQLVKKVDRYEFNYLDKDGAQRNTVILSSDPKMGNLYNAIDAGDVVSINNSNKTAQIYKFSNENGQPRLLETRIINLPENFPYSANEQLVNMQERSWQKLAEANTNFRKLTDEENRKLSPLLKK